jgi:hypothetical protein
MLILKSNLRVESTTDAAWAASAVFVGFPAGAQAVRMVVD